MQNFEQTYQTESILADCFHSRGTGIFSSLPKITDISMETASKNKMAFHLISQKFHDELFEKVYHPERITRMARECKMELGDYLNLI